MGTILLGPGASLCIGMVVGLVIGLLGGFLGGVIYTKKKHESAFVEKKEQAPPPQMQGDLPPKKK